MDMIFYNVNDNSTSSSAAAGVGFKSAAFLKVGAAVLLAIASVIG